MIDGLRQVRDADGEQLCALIGGIFAEYPGCVLEPEGQDRDLLALETFTAGTGGEMWVVERDGNVVACCGWSPYADGAIELKRLYVGAPARRQGLGAALTMRVEDVARARGASAIELWSDTRFTDAHRLYEGQGFGRLPETRELHDASNSVEYHFRKQL
ncbi:MAG: GNAT family N-acetyltransferase [Mycobacteriales bacterium]